MRSSIKRLYELAERSAPDVLSAQMRFVRHHGRFANLHRPRSFSELVLHRQLFERDPRFGRFADKIEAKRIVARTLGAEWIIPSLWEGDELPPISERSWRAPFVIKASHGSGWNIFVREAPDWPMIERETQLWLQNSYGAFCREHFYDTIPHRLLVEPLMGNPAELPVDLKFYCFGGRVEYIMAQSERHLSLKVAVLDRDWNLLPVRYTFERPRAAPKRPATLARLIEASEALSSGFEFVRMDFYEIDGRPLFGEYTFTPGAGLEVFDPYSFNLAFGAKWLAVRNDGSPSRGQSEDAPRPAQRQSATLA